MKKECMQCHSYFNAKRSSAKFCSDAHRVKFNRNKEKTELQITIMVDNCTVTGGREDIINFINHL